MNDVSLEIGGRPFRVACAPGEESHIARLGAIIDRKLADNPGMASQSEARVLLYAALLLADEVHELRQAVPAQPTVSAEALELLADHLEEVAERLEEPAANA